jgi:hypothetical protein
LAFIRPSSQIYVDLAKSHNLSVLSFWFYELLVYSISGILFTSKSKFIVWVVFSSQRTTFQSSKYSFIRKKTLELQLFLSDYIFMIFHIPRYPRPIAMTIFKSQLSQCYPSHTCPYIFLRKLVKMKIL